MEHVIGSNTVFTNSFVNHVMSSFTEQKDLPVKPKKEWAHMEKLEYDKLEWLKDLPPPSADSKEVKYNELD